MPDIGRVGDRKGRPYGWFDDTPPYTVRAVDVDSTFKAKMDATAA